MIILGVTGYARAGKDSVADVLVREHGFEKRSFAAPLKEMLRKLNPIITTSVMRQWDDGSYSTVMGDWRLSELIDDLGLTENEIKEQYPEYRRLLQVLGTDCIRALDEDFWVRAAKQTLTDPNGRYVFTDCRMPNEADTIHDLSLVMTGGGYDDFDYLNQADVWTVSRRGTKPTGEVHVSESYVGQLGESYEIINNGPLEALSEAVKVGLEFSFPEVFTNGAE